MTDPLVVFRAAHKANERMDRALTEKAWLRYTELLAAREARNAAALVWWRAQRRPMVGS